MWSAAKVRGKRLYAYARRGENVERKPREVYIRALEAMAIDVPVVKFRVNCSKGTYVRTLVHEVGRKLGCGAYLTALVRTKIGDYSLHDAVTIEQLASACRMQGIPSAGKLGAQ
jgi:tRNA pseudouridine55 synthase